MELLVVVRLLCFSCSLFYCAGGFKVALIRQRRQMCEDGFYHHNELKCCRCPKGYYVETHCSVSENVGKCELCTEGINFLDHANGQEKCEVCAICNKNANKVVKKKCTPSSNTVCECQEGHYCSKPECTACHLCDTCLETGVKEKCTNTKNTVCHEKTQNGAVAAAVIVPLAILIVIAVVIVLKRKRMLCFKDSSKEISQETQPLQDRDLSRDLPEIAPILGWSTVKDIVRPLVTEVEIENVQNDYPQNTGEQTFRVLTVWYEKHGLNGAYGALIHRLNKKGYREKARQVQEIVTRANA